MRLTASILLTLIAISTLTGCGYRVSRVYVSSTGAVVAVDLDIRADAQPVEAAPLAERTPILTVAPLPAGTPEHAPTGTPEPQGRACVVTLNGGDYLRVRDGIWGAHVRWLADGAAVTVIGAEWDTSGDLWYQTAAGWVAAWLVGC